MLSSTSDGIEASELKRPLTPPADTDTDEKSSPRKRGRPKKAPTRCTIDIDTNFDDNLETSFGDGWQMSPQNNVFTPHYLDPDPTYNSSQVSNSTLVNGGVDSLANNQVKKLSWGSPSKYTGDLKSDHLKSRNICGVVGFMIRHD